MKKLFSATLILIAASAHANGGPWLGNVVIKNVHHGETSSTPFMGQPVADNLADYNEFSVSFEYNPEISSGVQVDAQVELVQDSNGNVIGREPAVLVGQDGNNMVFNVDLDPIKPVTVAGPPPELQNGGTMATHLWVVIEGQLDLSIPFQFTYAP